MTPGMPTVLAYQEARGVTPAARVSWDPDGGTSRMALDSIADPAVVLELCVKIGDAPCPAVAQILAAFAYPHVQALDFMRARAENHMLTFGTDWSVDRDVALVVAARRAATALHLLLSVDRGDGVPNLRDAYSEILLAEEMAMRAAVADVLWTQAATTAQGSARELAEARVMTALRERDWWYHVRNVLGWLSGDSSPCPSSMHKHFDEVLARGAAT